jgi:hypothetical protein
MTCGFQAFRALFYIEKLQRDFGRKSFLPKSPLLITVFITWQRNVLPRRIQKVLRWLRPAKGGNMENKNVFEKWYSLDQKEQNELIKDLEAQPDRKLDAMRAVLKSAWKSRWRSAVQAIRAIGYPDNAAALPELVIDQIGDRNSAGWAEAVQTLLEMPLNFVSEYIIWVLWDRGKTIPYWSSVAEGVCMMLSQIKADYALYCCPVLVYLLSEKNLPEDFDQSVLLDVLEVIPPQNIIYALPAFIDLAEQNAKDTSIGEQVRSLMTRFDENILEPYQKLIANIL